MIEDIFSDTGLSEAAEDDDGVCEGQIDLK